MVAVGDKATADWANNRPKITYGVQSLTPSAANTATAGAPVTFPAGFFTAAPSVQLTLNGASANTSVTLSASAITAAGFTPNIYAGNTTARVVSWVAIGVGP